MSLESLQRRLSDIEGRLGLALSDGGADDGDLQRRLDRLERQLAQKLAPHELRETLEESDRLLREELHPGPALTYRTDLVAAPLLYRRQAVLAAAPELRADLDRLDEVRTLLEIGQAAAPAPAGTGLSADRIEAAPILSVREPPDAAARAAACLDACLALQRRVAAVAAELDAMLDRRRRLLALASAKTLALDDALTRRERAAGAGAAKGE